MPDCGASCCSKGGDERFVAEIEAAQEELKRRKPALFNANGSLAVGEDGVHHRAREAHHVDVRPLRHRRHRGSRGSISDDEVGIKRDNGLSQNTDVIAGYNNSPYVGGVYTCRPASF